MFEAKSADVRRFFDLLGSIFCVLLYSLIIWQEVFRFQQPDRFFYLPLFFAVGLAIYMSFYHLIWRRLNTRFLYGYANFLLISVLSVSTAGVLAIFIKLVTTHNPPLWFNQIDLFTLRALVAKVLLFYWATSLPMALFWLIGVLTVWKFSKRNFLR
jgi:hypothetical protein